MRNLKREAAKKPRDLPAENRRDNELYHRLQYRCPLGIYPKFKAKLGEDGVTFSEWIRIRIEKYLYEVE